MSLIQNQIPEFSWDGPVDDIDWEAPDDVLARWLAFANLSSGGDTIDIFDVIGADIFGDGISEKDVAKELNARSGKEVRVRINSPGGDVFSGLAIYNLLRNHNAKVTVEVMGVAASAASIVAMAADEIVMAQGSLMMIHNAWGMTVGNQDDMREAMNILTKIDGQMAGIYSARTGMETSAVSALLKAETWFTHEEAVEAKFADAVDSANKVSAKAGKKDKNPVQEKRRLERALGRMGVPRNKRPEIVSLILDDCAERDAGTPNAERDAGKDTEVLELLSSLKDIFKI